MTSFKRLRKRILDWPLPNTQCMICMVYVSIYRFTPPTLSKCGKQIIHRVFWSTIECVGVFSWTPWFNLFKQQYTVRDSETCSIFCFQGLPCQPMAWFEFSVHMRACTSHLTFMLRNGIFPKIPGGFFCCVLKRAANKIFQHVKPPEPGKKTRGPLLSRKCWLFNRDPYNGSINSPHNWVGVHPQQIP